jgi:hypothetical protein
MAAAGHLLVMAHGAEEWGSPLFGVTHMSVSTIHPPRATLTGAAGV